MQQSDQSRVSMWGHVPLVVCVGMKCWGEHVGTCRLPLAV